MIHKLAARFGYLDSLIRKRATGTPKELATRLGITKRGWYKLRNQLVNDLNVPLAYDSYSQTYYYKEEGRSCLDSAGNWMLLIWRNWKGGGC